MPHNTLNAGLMNFIQASPTPYHAVSNLSSALDDAGFLRLEEGRAWQLVKKQGYYVVRGGTSIVAFKTGEADLVESGIHMVGAHTDSPCLKVKPQPDIIREQYVQLGVEVYGVVLLKPWFDRDLSLPERVDNRDQSGHLKHVLVNF